eukprot:1610404-Prymnesium_polylepis.1
MNTVLDDNKTLCLANAERIKLSDQMRMLFEVQDLAVASPATVSRCGMVYMSEANLTWRPHVASWADAELPAAGWDAQMREALLDLFELHVPAGLRYVRDSAREAISTRDMQLVASLCNLYAALMGPLGLARPVGSAEPFAHEARAIPHLFAFCFVWTIGASIDADHWAGFDELCRSRIDPSADLFPPSGDVRDFVP